MSGTRYTPGDLVWCLFGDGYSIGWLDKILFWRRDSDACYEGVVLDVLDGGAVLVIEYEQWHTRMRCRDWFTRENVAKQVRPRRPPVSSLAASPRPSSSGTTP